MPQSVLIVDDSLLLHSLIRAHLETQEIKLLSAYDGPSALTMAATAHPSLILLDVDLPTMDGFEVCRALKANPATASVPLMFLTGDSVAANKVKGLKMGAIDYITKPFTPEELQARVRLALRAKSEANCTEMVDSLTGLWNRAYLDRHLPAQLSMAKRLGRSLACIVGEIDELTSIIAKHGEAVANEIVRKVGEILRGHCRIEDVLCRVGTGRMALLLGGANTTTASRIANRMRANVKQKLRLSSGIEMNVTCSFGVAEMQEGGDTTVFDGADAAAHCAALLGNNRISIAASPPPKPLLMA